MRFATICAKNQAAVIAKKVTTTGLTVDEDRGFRVRRALWRGAPRTAPLLYHSICAMMIYPPGMQTLGGVQRLPRGQRQRPRLPRRG